MGISKTKSTTLCYHCGERVINAIQYNEKDFCCQGCKAVYQLLNSNDLCDYYQISNAPGKQQEEIKSLHQYDILNDTATAERLINFKNSTDTHIAFYIPFMHCSSCIYLLENMHKLNPYIVSSRVNFQKKEVEVVFHHQQISLKEVALLLHKIGYPPYLSLASESQGTQKKKSYKERIYKIGIAGFCFGNIMMLSFPEYFKLSDFSDTGVLNHVFNILSLILSLPVLFYCSQEFFVSAWVSLKQRYLNIDLPIALAVLITFLRSVYEITYGVGVGYFDSMSGIVFFMLIGRYFQNKTYDHISFERDYKSYFPLGVTVLESENGTMKQKIIPVSAIKTGMRMIIRQNELIPADGILFQGDAEIDYSFVTGEADTVKKTLGEIIYAGGRQKGSQLELEVVKEVSQSYLTSLWNKHETNDIQKQETEIVATINKYFTYSLLVLALGAFIFWWPDDKQKAINAVTTILIVACPCALLLGATFTYGNVLQILAKNKLYVKNAQSVERLSKADTLVFDKTGTITQNNITAIEWVGLALSPAEKELIYSLASQSLHPLSKRIVSYLNQPEVLITEHFLEHTGKGIEGTIQKHKVRLGATEYIGNFKSKNKNEGSTVHCSIDDVYKGYFNFKNVYREGVFNLFQDLQHEGYEIHILSGDNDEEKEHLKAYIKNDSFLNFKQSPQDKLNYIEKLNKQGKKVVMIGDGLNDAGALLKSYSGISVTDDVNYFTPMCSAILEGDKLHLLKQYLQYVKSGNGVLKASFVLSILYNLVGLSYALTGTLQPVIAAILMPASTISIVLFTTASTNIFARKLLK